MTVGTDCRLALGSAQGGLGRFHATVQALLASKCLQSVSVPCCSTGVKFEREAPHLSTFGGDGLDVDRQVQVWLWHVVRMQACDWAGQRNFDRTLSNTIIA